jgi:hypothetical protein
MVKLPPVLEDSTSTTDPFVARPRATVFSEYFCERCESISSRLPQGIDSLPWAMAPVTAVTASRAAARNGRRYRDMGGGLFGCGRRNRRRQPGNHMRQSLIRD